MVTGGQGAGGGAQGEMAATAVNAPMMPPAVLRELQPFVSLAAGLGRTAVQLVGGDGGFTQVPPPPPGPASVPLRGCSRSALAPMACE